MDFGNINAYIIWGLSVTGGVIVTFYNQTKNIVEKEVTILVNQRMKEFETEFKNAMLKEVERLNDYRFGGVHNKLDTISDSIQEMKNEVKDIRSDINKTQKDLTQLQFQVSNNTTKINKND